MNFEDYADAAASTAVYPGSGEFNGLAYAALGLAGEAGEAAEKIKKLWCDNGVANLVAQLAIVAPELLDLLGHFPQLPRPSQERRRPVR